MFENLTERFNNLETNKDYWFIRTSKGKNFEPFKAQGFIGVNWNYITSQDLRNKTEAEIRVKIANNEKDSKGQLYDPATVTGKTKITAIYNKLKRFEALKKGDLIVMPSKNSEFLAFGYITDDAIFNKFEDDTCDFHKRRKVHWIVTKGLTELDPIFYKIVFAKHAISKLNGYASYIDKIVSNVFVKDNRSHLVMEVRTEEDINFDSLTRLMQSVRDFTSIINHELHFGEDLSSNSIKLNVQSPGTIEYIYNTGRSLLIASLLLAIPINVSCSHGEASERATIQEKQQERTVNLKTIRDTINAQHGFTQAEKDSIYQLADIHYDNLAETKANMAETDSIVDSQDLID